MRLFKLYVCVIGIIVIGMVVNVYYAWKKSFTMSRLTKTSIKNLPFAWNSQQDVIWQNYTTVGLNQFFIFTIIGVKSDDNRRWDLVAVTGWETRQAVNESYTCCFFDNYGGYTFSIATKKYKHLFRSKGLEATQVLCKIPLDMFPTTFSLLLPKEDCAAIDKRENILYPKVEKDGKFAVCAKIAFGKKEANHLVEWIEYQRYLGASKIVIYPYQDLNKPALNVLQYYSEVGVIELVPMSYVPELKKWKRYFPDASGTAFNDNHVPMLDIHPRFQGYKYFTIIDTDEFIAPNMSIAKTYSQLIDYLMKVNPTASHFSMRTQFHAMTWNRTNSKSDLMLGQYGNRSESMIDRVKQIRVTDRVKPGSVWTHGCQSKPGYKKITLKETEAVLKHYRLCNRGWLKPSNTTKPNKCFGGFKVQYDPYMVEIVEAIGPNVRKIKHILGL